MTTEQKPSKAINITLWIAQIILAAMFIMAGIMKSTQPIEKLSPSLPWTSQVPELLVRFIGVSELLGAIGLLLPSLLRIKPKLTVWAAAGIATIMLFAILFHISKGETAVIGINIFIALIALFVVWGRTKQAVILPKD
jgi:uncharacterized membrane protein YphA (DoxX/SURF4 family)